MVAGLAAMLAVRASSPSESGGRRPPGADGQHQHPRRRCADRVVRCIGVGNRAALRHFSRSRDGPARPHRRPDPEQVLAGRRVAVAAGGVGAAITAARALGWALSRTDQAVNTAILGLRASVIVYLVPEELLREVHETGTGPLEVAVLFGALLPFFLAGITTRG